METRPQDSSDVETPHWALGHVDDFGFAIHPRDAWERMRTAAASDEPQEAA